jgi:hypothetical protein
LRVFNFSFFLNFSFLVPLPNPVQYNPVYLIPKHPYHQDQQKLLFFYFHIFLNFQFTLMSHSIKLLIFYYLILQNQIFILHFIILLYLFHSIHHFLNLKIKNLLHCSLFTNYPLFPHYYFLLFQDYLPIKTFLHLNFILKNFNYFQ